MEYYRDFPELHLQENTFILDKKIKTYESQIIFTASAVFTGKLCYNTRFIKLHTFNKCRVFTRILARHDLSR
jgi:hypothetical protein